jgi:hypothetical protein
MMPFDASFNTVYESIRQAADKAGFRCWRVDDIWENAAIIQDVVALIDRSRVVVCDCSGRECAARFVERDTRPVSYYRSGLSISWARRKFSFLPRWAI